MTQFDTSVLGLLFQSQSILNQPQCRHGHTFSCSVLLCCEQKRQSAAAPDQTHVLLMTNAITDLSRSEQREAVWSLFITGKMKNIALTDMKAHERCFCSAGK